jgi:membrane-associated phospholipid phosphatase
LPHNGRSEVDEIAYSAYLRALETGRHADFEAIPMGGTGKLVSPQTAYAFALEGADPHQVPLRAAPSIYSAEAAGEMVELYWMALTRDIPFNDYASNGLISQCAAELSTLSDYRGPKQNGTVTADVVFRGNTPGDASGPFISQFLWKPMIYGNTPVPQLYRTTVPGSDYLTDFDSVLALQRGAPAPGGMFFDSTLRYIRNHRDLAVWVHKDFSYQAFLNAALVLLSAGSSVVPEASPYRRSRSQAAFSTFGSPFVLDLVARVTNAALKAAWCQKWLIHRKTRPEAFGAHVHLTSIGQVNHSFHPDLMQSTGLRISGQSRGSYLLSSTYPEGAPSHPSYPSGHAAISGACVTVLKCLFNEAAFVPDPVVASSDGLSLTPWQGAPLTVGGELNKLAWNVSSGRNAAGIHYRSDAVEGMRLGEAVAVAIIRDEVQTLHEQFAGWRFTSFDGQEISIKREVMEEGE